MNRLFFAHMAISSALTLVRGFLIAHLLSPGAFGTYALLLALGTFSASLIGFGQIERTFKRFPRLFEDGHAEAALREADGIGRMLLRRALALGAVGVAVAAAISGRDLASGLACAVGLAAGVAVQSTYISVHRASAELVPLGRSALARSALALAFAATGAMLASWPGAMVGEIAAAGLGAWISRAFALRTVSRIDAVPARPLEAPGREMWLFTAFIVAAAPLYLDRGTVSLLLGTVAAGSYSLLMLFVAGANTVTAIVSQKLGPQLVRLERSGARFRTQVILLLQWILGIGALCVTGMAVAGAVLLYGPLASLGAKYGLGPELFLAATAMCVGQVSHLIEWSLLSHDRERSVFAAAIAYLAMLGLGLATSMAEGGGLLAFMWTMAAGKLFHVGLLSALLLWNRRAFIMDAARGRG